MRKKIIVLYTAILLALICNIPVSAADNDDNMSKAVSAYCLEDTLYTFVEFLGNSDPEQLSGTLMLNDVSIAKSTLVIPPQNSFTKTHYVLLVDLSTSMQSYVEKVNRFADGLAEAGASEAVFSVLTFGDQFEVVSENLTDPKEMLAAVNHLQYNGVLSNPYEGVEQAIKYLSGCPRPEGELLNLILVTDGNLYLGDMLESERQALENEKAKSTSELITSSPEIVLHTLRVGEWEPLADQTFSKGTGLQLHSANKDVPVLARELTGFTEKLYRIDFSFRPAKKDQKLDVTLQIKGRENGELFYRQYELKSIPVLKASPEPESKGDDGTPSQPDPDSDGEKEKPPSEKTPDGESEENKPQDKEPEEDEPQDKEPEEDEPQDKEPKEDESRDSEDNEQKDVMQNNDQSVICTDQWILIVSILGIVIVLLIIIIAFLLARKKSQMKQNKTSQEGSIYMRLDVISGNLSDVSKEFYLQDQLIIGRSRKCDIVWKDKCVSEKNTRIYIENQKVYIEDLNSAEGTALGGMRLHAPNILRSGDQISIGNVCFVLRF